MVTFFNKKRIIDINQNVKTMIVYRKTKSGFIETLHTVGTYKPKGWSLSKPAASKRNK